MRGFLDFNSISKSHRYKFTDHRTVTSFASCPKGLEQHRIALESYCDVLLHGEGCLFKMKVYRDSKVRFWSGIVTSNGHSNDVMKYLFSKGWD